jgi:hypothetical protein
MSDRRPRSLSDRHPEPLVALHIHWRIIDHMIAVMSAKLLSLSHLILKKVRSAGAAKGAFCIYRFSKMGVDFQPSYRNSPL